MIKRQVNPPDTSSFLKKRPLRRRVFPQPAVQRGPPRRGPPPARGAPTPGGDRVPGARGPAQGATPRLPSPERAGMQAAPSPRPRVPVGSGCCGGRKSPGTTNRGMLGTVPCSSQEMSFVQPHRKPRRGLSRAARQSASEPAPRQLPRPPHKGRRSALAPGRPPPAAAQVGACPRLGCPAAWRWG